MRKVFAGVVSRLAFTAVGILLAGTPRASAQAPDDYYQELRVEDRIYVFSTEKRFTVYGQSKDLGVSITRLGYGPNGETVVFEDAKAIEAFNRKYGLSEAPPEEVKISEVKLPFGVQYRMPGLRLSFPKAEINLSNRLQVRYTHESFDDIENPPATLPTSLEDKGSFRIRRFKTKFDGWIYSKDLTFELQLNWPDSSNVLEDANLDYDFTGGKKLFRLKAGQFKAPFSQQQLTSSGNQQLVDRSILDSPFAPGAPDRRPALGPGGTGRDRGLRRLALRRFQRKRPDRFGQRQRRLRVRRAGDGLAVGERRLLRVQPRGLRPAPLLRGRVQQQRHDRPARNRREGPAPTSRLSAQPSS